MFVLGRMEGRRKSFFVSSDEFIFDSPKEGVEKEQGVMTSPQPSPGGREQDFSQNLGAPHQVLPLGEDLGGVFSYISNLPQPGS